MQHRKRYVCAVSDFCTIIDDICWKSQYITLNPRCNETFTGMINRGPGIFVIYGILKHHSIEPLKRKAKVKIILYNENNKEDKIIIKDELSTETPKIANRIIVSKDISWDIKVKNCGFVNSKIKFIITKRMGLEDIYKEKINFIESNNIFACIFNRNIDLSLNFNEYASYQQERILSVLDKWPDNQNNKVLEYPIKLILPELKRDSVYKNEAYHKGLIRPFLLLVSMDPELRIQFGKLLRIDITENRFFGDSHQEAYDILFHPKIGIEERASNAFIEKFGNLDVNWYQIIYRVTKTAIKGSNLFDEEFRNNLKNNSKNITKSRQSCLDPHNEDILKMEEIYVSGIVSTIIDIFKETDIDAWNEIECQMNSPEIDSIYSKLVHCGFTNELINRVISVFIINGAKTEQLFNVLKKWSDNKREGRVKDRFRIALPVALLGAQITLFAVLAAISPLMILPVAMLAANSLAYVYRDTPGKLLKPLILLTMQRVTLSCNNVLVRNYYPSKESLQHYLKNKTDSSLLAVISPYSN